MPAATTIVVPCFNEAARLRPEGFAPLLDRPGTTLLFVDDGSGDDTPARLAAIAAAHPRARVHTLARNSGKSEAVRQGLLRALAEGAELAGYLDADLATPAEEMLRLIAALERRADVDAVLGSRVLLLGRDIERRPARHYAGRVFAAGASLVLGVPVYDTQCGAKMFRVTPRLREALAEPFHSRWAFDVELIGRILPRNGAPPRIVEVPLETWRDIDGSTLRLPQMLRAGLEVGRIAVELRRWRRRRGG